MASRPIHTLSGGQKQRLALAGALASDANLFLLDEPTAGLEWSVRDEVLLLLAKIAKEQLLIVVTHEPELFKNLFSSAYRLQEGQLRPMTTLSSN